MSRPYGRPAISGIKLPHTEFFACTRAKVNISLIQFRIRSTRKYCLVLHTTKPSNHFGNECGTVIASADRKFSRERRHDLTINNSYSVVNL